MSAWIRSLGWPDVGHLDEPRPLASGGSTVLSFSVPRATVAWPTRASSSTEPSSRRSRARGDADGDHHGASPFPARRIASANASSGSRGTVSKRASIGRRRLEAGRPRRAEALHAGVDLAHTARVRRGRLAKLIDRVTRSAGSTRNALASESVAATKLSPPLLPLPHTTTARRPRGAAGEILGRLGHRLAGPLHEVGRRDPPRLRRAIELDGLRRRQDRPTSPPPCRTRWRWSARG